MVMDFLESQRLLSSPGLLKAPTFGSAPTERMMSRGVKRRFEGNVVSEQSYGLSETNTVAVSVQEDYLCRPEGT